MLKLWRLKQMDYSILDWTQPSQLLKTILSQVSVELLSVVSLLVWALLRLSQALTKGKIKGISVHLLGKEVVELSIQKGDGNKIELDVLAKNGSSHIKKGKKVKKIVFLEGVSTTPKKDSPIK